MAEVSWRWKHPSFMGKENGFSKRFTQMRNSESGAWLRELNFETVRYSLKRLHDTYSRAFDNAKKGIIGSQTAKRRQTAEKPLWLSVISSLESEYLFYHSQRCPH